MTWLRKHPVQAIIEHHLKNGMTPPVFRKIRGAPHHNSGMSWWIHSEPGGHWSHVTFLGDRQFVDGVEL